jgi:hypothetical protein
MEELLTIKDLKRVLGISYGVIIAHVQQGLIPAYKVTGEPVRREEVTEWTTGLRFEPSDVREYLSKVLVK